LQAGARNFHFIDSGLKIITLALNLQLAPTCRMITHSIFFQDFSDFVVPTLGLHP